jgi:hypothetical protein
MKASAPLLATIVTLRFSLAIRLSHLGEIG